MTILHRFRKDCRVILYIEDVDFNAYSIKINVSDRSSSTLRMWI